MIYILNERFMFFMNMWKRVDGTSACREKQCRFNPVMFQSMTQIKSGNWPKNSYNIFAGTNTYMEKCMTHLMEFRSSVRTWNKNVEEKNEYMTISMHDVKNPSRQSPVALSRTHCGAEIHDTLPISYDACSHMSFPMLPQRAPAYCCLVFWQFAFLSTIYN